MHLWARRRKNLGSTTLTTSVLLKPTLQTQAVGLMAIVWIISEVMCQLADFLAMRTFPDSNSQEENEPSTGAVL